MIALIVDSFGLLLIVWYKNLMPKQTLCFHD